ncbi:HEPN domain-containing protein [Singulisphaera sp. GP187]|uniref:HEPN domain-containing protein n=1 Tax=Singulisphaera sp. GP187 TaxID=1882752 RepID=UPI00092AD400|nr:HEPN domain-containing protein [Singulisphaera sp. GP187]
MAVPISIEARLYYRCAFQRYDDAQVLLRADHTTGAVYLAGYGIECILKALVLSELAPTARAELLNSFRGSRAHEYDWLRTRYLKQGGARFPRDITEAFTLVNDWSTEMRYLPRTLRVDEAVGFLSAAERIIRWVDGRL